MYGARYISDRDLPDKAIDLVDEAASALRLAQESKPDELEALDRDVIKMEIELESLKAETDVFSVERRAKIEKDLRERKEKAQELTAIWQSGTPRTPQVVLPQADANISVQSGPALTGLKIPRYALKRLSTSSMSLSVMGTTNGRASSGSQAYPTLNANSRRNLSLPRMVKRLKDRLRWSTRGSPQMILRGLLQKQLEFRFRI